MSYVQFLLIVLMVAVLGTGFAVLGPGHHWWHEWADTTITEGRPRFPVRDSVQDMMRLQRCLHCDATRWRRMGY